jgi:hypothetical protein
MRTGSRFLLGEFQLCHRAQHHLLRTKVYVAIQTWERALYVNWEKPRLLNDTANLQGHQYFTSQGRVSAACS